MRVKKQHLEPCMEQLNGLGLRKEYDKAVHCQPVYLTYMKSTSLEMRAGWVTSWNQDCQEKYQQPQICRCYHPNGRKQGGTKEPFDENEGGEWKINIQKTKILASGPIASWHIHGEKVETMTDFSLLGLSNHCRRCCSHEIRRRALLGRRAKTNVDSVLEAKTSLSDNGPYGQSHGLPISHVRMWELVNNKGWALKNRCFPTMVLEKTPKSPLDCKVINQSILKEINSQYS